MINSKTRKAQIWVETVLYTLIGLTILGMVLGLAKPKIEEMKDKAIIEQSIDMLNAIDQTIDDIKFIEGNSRPIELKIQKGQLILDGEENYIEFKLEKSNSKYSQPGQVIENAIGNIDILTTGEKKPYTVSLKLDYSGSADITWNEENALKTFQPSPTVSKIWATNKGFMGGIPNIDFS